MQEFGSVWLKRKDEKCNLCFEFKPLVRSLEFSALSSGFFLSLFHMKVP
jgi:hypothetical protein